MLIKAAGSEDPLESCVGSKLSSHAKSATAPPTPTTHPTSRPTLLLFAFSDNNMSTVVMIVVMLIAIASASGSSSPLVIAMNISCSWTIAEASSLPPSTRRLARRGHRVWLPLLWLPLPRKNRPLSPGR